MNLTQAISELRRLNEPVPKPQRLPTEDEITTLEADIGHPFPADMRRLLLEASDVFFGTLSQVTATDPTFYTHYTKVREDADAYGIPSDLIPVCEDNADFFVVLPDGRIGFWSHNDGEVTEYWPSLADWIIDVWIEETDDDL